MKKKKCITVVPIYKEKPSDFEDLSLKQYNNVMKGCDVCIIHPESLDVKSYMKYFNDNNVTEKSFDDKFFKHIRAYSQLCLDYNFYNTFNDYEYMLIYQPDCWIFNDKLDEWCDKGYDYVGAPIYSKLSKWPSLLRGNRPVVGNGGFSLRKIETMLKITDHEGYVYKKHADIWDKIEYEDMFICDGITQVMYLNIPDYKIAEKFAYDCLPNNFEPEKVVDELFGAHRVFTYGKIWLKVIPEFDNKYFYKWFDIWAKNFENKIITQ